MSLTDNWRRMRINNIIILVIICSSCSVTKAKRTVKTDSTTVVRVDSTAIRAAGQVRRLDSVYMKETLYFGRDTITNNYYTQPAIIVRETGKKQLSEQRSAVAITQRSVTDSANVIHTDIQKEKHTNVLTPMQLILILLSAILLFKLLPDLKIKR